MMALDHCRITLAAFDHIRIDRPLRQRMNMPDISRFFFKHPDELLPHDPSLRLRVRDFRKLIKEPLLRIHTDQMNAQFLSESPFHKIRFSFAQKPVIHKNAGQVFTHRPVKHDCRHRRIHPARKRQQDLFALQLLPVSLYNIRRVIINLPGPCAAADRKQEIAQDLHAVNRVGHLRMKLHAVQLSPVIAHGRAWASLRFSQDIKTIRDAADIIRMTHPADALLRNILKEHVIPYPDQCFSVFAGLFSTGDSAARHIRHQLRSVTDTQDRDSQIQNAGIIMGRIRIIDTVRTSGKNDPAVSLIFYLIRQDPVIRSDLRVDSQITYPAGYKLIVLTTKIKHKYFLH